jgi:hypothetical protein
VGRRDTTANVTRGSHDERGRTAATSRDAVTARRTSNATEIALTATIARTGRYVARARSTRYGVL